MSINQHLNSLDEFDENHQPDERLWELFKSGNREEFTKIYHLHVDALYNYGLNLNRDSTLVKEEIQDLFVYLWNKRNNLGKTTNIRFYLLRSLRRKLNIASKEKMKWEFFGGYENLNVAGLLSKKALDIFSQSKKESTEEVALKLKTELNKLPIRQRETLYSIFYENFTYEEVAGIMNIHIKTVYNLAWRGIETLRKNLK